MVLAGSGFENSVSLPIWCSPAVVMTKASTADIWCLPEVILAEAAGELIFLSDFVEVEEGRFVLFAEEEEEEAAALGEEGRMMVRITDLIVFDCEVPEFVSPWRSGRSGKRMNPG